MRVALIQLNSSDDPQANLAVLQGALTRAADQGAKLILTPEVTNCVSASRARQEQVLRHEDDDPTLAAVRDFAADRAVWVLIGSLALKTDDADGRFANRSFLIGPRGQIAARYDKIHMFDVAVSPTETYRESAGYRPGAQAVVTQTPLAALGLTICYDLRFPHLFRDLAQAGAQIITVPSAFSSATGAAHWHALLQARAIENGCFILASAQTGTHAAAVGKRRQTFGHSLAVDPWGRVLLDAGVTPGVYCVDLNLKLVAETRQKVPSLAHDRPYSSPKGRV